MGVLVTGGAGFVGSHLVDACLERGYETYVIDNLSTGREENLSPQAELIKADLSQDDLESIIAKINPEIIFHLAAQSSVPVSIKQPLFDQQVNIQGTIKLLEAARLANVRKIIYASSAAAYGNPAYLPIDEKHPIQPISFYGISKYVPELYLKTYMDLYKLPFTALRYANIYGPRQIAHGEGGVVAIFIDHIIHGEAITIQGDGEQTRDFIFVSDIVEANLAAMEHGDGEILNIGTGIKTSVIDLVGALQKVSDAPLTVNRAAPREGDIRHSYFNSERAMSILVWQPKIDLVEGLRKTFQFYRNHS